MSDPVHEFDESRDVLRKLFEISSRNRIVLSPRFTGQKQLSTSLFTLFCLLMLLVTRTSAQNNGGNVNQGNQGQGQGQNNAGGIKVDPQGVATLAVIQDQSGALEKRRRAAASHRSDSSEISKASSERFVSLVSVERQLDECLKESRPVPDELFFLAGLQRIDRVFVLPESNDLVISGPADGLIADGYGRMVGIDSGHPVLRLDDLVVALRTTIKSQEIGCSIDPVPERLLDLQNFISKGRPANAAAVEARFAKMDDILGMQDVRIDGVPVNSHFGLSLVEADYRMKRVSLGLENPGIKGFKSHLAMIGAGGNTLQRWWFIPLYDAIYHTEDRLAFEFVGQRAQLLAQEELVNAQGGRSASPTTHVSTKDFARQFTLHYDEIAEKIPVFGELQNLIDLAVLGALIHREQLASRIEWKMSTLLDDSKYTIPRFEVPRKVPSMVNHKRTGNMIVGLVAGGVTVHTDQVIRTISPVKEADQSLKHVWQRTNEHQAKSQPASKQSWWWDTEQKSTSSKLTTRKQKK